MGLGPFTDMSDEEFLSVYTMEPNHDRCVALTTEGYTSKSNDLASNFDWEEKGMVTPVKH